MRAVSAVPCFVLGIAIAGAMATLPLQVFAQDERILPSTDSGSSSTPTSPSEPQQNQGAVSLASVPAQVDENVGFWRSITVNGFASLSYLYNTNDPEFRINQYRVFDYADEEPQLDMAQLVIQRAIDKPNQFGFRLNMIAGSAIPKVTAAYGMFRNCQTWQAGNFDIPEVYVSYIAPLGKGLRFDAGKFATHMGAEVIGGYDGYNDEFSRSFLFGFGVPFTNTGVKATYAFNSKISAMFLVTNGWDEVQHYNHELSIGGQTVLTATKNTAFYFNWLHGPTMPHNNTAARSAFEIVGNWKTTSKLSLGFDSLYAYDRNGICLGFNSVWKSLVGYTKYQLASKLSLALRGEVFNDSGGTRTGIPQTLHEFTLAPEYDMAAKISNMNEHLKKLDGKFVVRGDIRLDTSDKNVFQRDDYWVANQFTTAVNLIYLF
jgi:hypothetical protein